MLNRVRKRILRSPLMAVLLVALVFRAAVPFGYMPAAAPDGGMDMVICPDHGLPAGDTGTQDDSHSGTTPCPYSLSAEPPLPSVHVAIAFEPPSRVEVGRPDFDSNNTFTPTRIQQARAPPVSTLIRF